MLIVGGVLRTPFVERERRIGNYHIERKEFVVFDEFRVIESKRSKT